MSLVISILGGQAAKDSLIFSVATHPPARDYAAAAAVVEFSVSFCRAVPIP